MGLPNPFDGGAHGEDRDDDAPGKMIHDPRAEAISREQDQERRRILAATARAPRPPFAPVGAALILLCVIASTVSDIVDGSKERSMRVARPAEPRSPALSGQAEAIAERIGAARQRTLGGRGTGVSASEVRQAQRERPLLGGRAAASERQDAADQATRARDVSEEMVRLEDRRSAAGQVAPARAGKGSHRPDKTSRNLSTFFAGTVIGATLAVIASRGIHRGASAERNTAS